MSKNKYDFKQVEEKWKKFWEKEKIYRFDSSNKKPVFSIDTPPPYVSGAMHMGHAFSYSQQDFIARFMRMFKGAVFYGFGTDDNGLPTERYVEKINKIKSKSMSRAKFIELCLKTLKKITPDFIKGYKDLGISADYNIYYSTIDKKTQKISQKAFIDLYNKRLAYKKEFPTIWCPECQTTIAQAELEDKEQDSLFSTLKFKCEDKDLLIATTRPELLGACVAVFVHPDDNRYKKIIGKKAKVALFDFEVPIIADKSADIGKGTGALMVCSYGDKFDVDAINRYKLVEKIILNTNGTIKEGEYKGLKIKEARKKILQDLKEKTLIQDQKQITNVVNVHDKCGTEIEFLPTEQWFIKILDNKKTWISQGKKINWYPKYMYKRYENWVNGLEWDWSISRERHFGIPFPVWDCKDCNELILAKENELPVDPLQTKKICSKCKKEAKGEEKVLDTWATSSLTPQIASSLINNEIKVPYSLRPQAHDIIRTWAFYTIVRSYLSEKKLPWKNIMISGYTKLGGEKMSKSKGTGIEPKKLLEEYGADALRFWAAGFSLGSDVNYQEQDLVAGKKFMIKLFNASRFVFMNLKNYNSKKANLIETDRLFLSRLNDLIEICTKNFKNYEYNKVKLETSHFFWHIFCDNYLELIKKRVYNGTNHEKQSAFFTLYNSLLILLKLMAPIIPFITEEIYQEYFEKKEKQKSIHISSWPKKLDIKQNKEDIKIFNELIKFNSEVWKKKKEKGISLRDEIREIKIPKFLDEFKKDLIATHNIV